jgi:LacI family transcriptional regulator, fructose operon transcriptional repressor
MHPGSVFALGTDEQRRQRRVNVSKASIRKSTIYDLASLAQTSASTVSAILNGTWQQRRISEDTAHRVRALAEAHKYNVNRQARGLRRSRSGLIGMIIPTHEDRFFGTMSQVFDRMARERKLQPIVVSTLRDPGLEVSTVKTLISYQIDHLVVTGATDPDGVSRICRHHNVMHVNVDLPGSAAPSVISDNYWGAAQLTSTLITRSTAQASKARDRLHFLGGVSGDHAIQRRIQGFSDTVKAAFGKVDADQIHTCGYEVSAAQAEVGRLHSKLGGLPRGLFLASSLSLEGAIRFLKTLPIEELQRCAFGSYDWDPFASYLRFPVHMVRQDVDGLLSEAFKVIDRGDAAHEQRIEVKPHLVLGD